MNDADWGCARTNFEVRVIIGKPGALVTAVNRRSPSTARMCSYAVTNQTWLPSHNRTGRAAGPFRMAANSGGGCNGHAPRRIGYDGTDVCCTTSTIHRPLSTSC